MKRNTQKTPYKLLGICTACKMLIQTCNVRIRKSIMELTHSLSHTWSQRHSQLLIDPYCMWVHECASVIKAKRHVSSARVSIAMCYGIAHNTTMVDNYIILHYFLSFPLLYLSLPYIHPDPHSPCYSTSWPCSNRSRTPPTCTSPTCRCLWMSRSWRTCWSPWDTSSPRGYWGMPMGSAEESASPGTQ